MKKLFEDYEFENAKSRDTLPLECYQCGKTFLKPKNQIQAALKKGSNCKTAGKFCSIPCGAKYHTKAQEVECLCCGKKFFKQLKEIEKTPNHFCTRSCAAKVNNVKAPKRVKEGACKRCGDSCHSNVKHCKKCLKDAAENKWLLKGVSKIDQRTLAEATDLNGSPANRYRGIRDSITKKIKRMFRKGLLKEECCVCGHDYVHICHIKGIGEFPADTLVGKINSFENITILCPNHHGALDKTKKLKPEDTTPVAQLLS